MENEEGVMICNACGYAINIITSGSVTIMPSENQKDNGMADILHFHSKCRFDVRKEKIDE